MPSLTDNGIGVLEPGEFLLLNGRELRAACDGCGKAWTLDLTEGFDGGDLDPWRAVDPWQEASKA